MRTTRDEPFVTVQVKFFRTTRALESWVFEQASYIGIELRALGKGKAAVVFEDVRCTE